MTDNGRGEEQPLHLSSDDKRKLYHVLDADIPSRMARLEHGIIVLGMLAGGQLMALLGFPNPIQAVLHLFS